MAYRRAQVIWSLWQVFAGPFRGEIGLDAVPKNFGRRVSNLIDLGAGIPNSRRSGQKGIDQEYEVEDGFELGIGLDLLGMGLPQKEVVNYLMGFRNELRRECQRLPDIYRRGAAPTFLVVRPVGIKETLRQGRPAPALEGGMLSFHEPLFVHDAAKLGQTLLTDTSGMDARRHLIIEVSDLKTKLVSYLQEAPEVKRGRQ
jgi:hypothetical protein